MVPFKCPFLVLSILPIMLKLTVSFLLLLRHSPTAPLALSVSKNWHEIVSRFSCVLCMSIELKSEELWV